MTQGPHEVEKANETTLLGTWCLLCNQNANALLYHYKGAAKYVVYKIN